MRSDETGAALAEALAPARQSRRLWLAAVTALLAARRGGRSSAGGGGGGRSVRGGGGSGGGAGRGDDSSRVGSVAALVTQLRAGGVISLAELDEATARERLRQQLAGVSGAPGIQRLAEATRFAAFVVEADKLVAAWLRAGVRLVTSAELCPHRDCVWPLDKRTPALLWVAGPGVAEPGAASGYVSARRVALVHSRKGRTIDSTQAWVQATRAAVAAVATDAAREGQTVIAVGGSHELPARLTRTAAALAGMTLIDVLAEPLPGAHKVWVQRDGSWGRAKQTPRPGGGVPAGTEPALVSSSAAHPASVSVSAVWPDESLRSTGAAHAARSLKRDELVLGLAQHAVAVTVRAGGNWQAQLMMAAREAPARRQRITVVDPAVWGFAEQGGRALIELGCAVAKAPLPAKRAGGKSGLRSGARATPPPPPPPPPASGTVPVPVPVLPAPSGVGGVENQPSTPWPWLTHWTRRPEGAWPGEADAAWLTRVLEGGVLAPPTALEALARIVSTRAILGSTRFLRHGPAVCLTEWPPEQLATLAQKQRHKGLGRPLYEPFGIGFQRGYLTSKGATPAVYGDEGVFATLSQSDRYRFQFAGDPAEPWSREGEWRLKGDLDFHEVEAQAVCLFVPDAASAAWLSKAVGAVWRVVVMGA